MDIYLDIAIVIVSLALIAIIVLQNKGAGLGGIGGGASSGGSYHVRRGVEKVLFNITIGLSVVFFALAILSVLLVG